MFLPYLDVYFNTSALMNLYSKCVLFTFICVHCRCCSYNIETLYFLLVMVVYIINTLVANSIRLRTTVVGAYILS